MAENNGQTQTAVDIFYDVFRSSPIGIAVEDLEGRPLFVNPAFCSMLGFSEEEMLAKHCLDFSPAEDAEKDWALFQQLRSGAINHYHLDKRYFRRDGSLFWGHLSISLLNHRSSPLVVAMVEDITEKVVAQETLELATKDMLAVIRLDRDFHYIWASDGYAKWIQRPMNEIIGSRIPDVLGKDGFEALLPHFTRVLAGEKVSYEQEISVQAVGRRWVSSTCTPTYDPARNVNGWVASVIDITDRKAAEEEHVRHAAIVGATDDAIYSTSSDDVILSWNRGAQKLFGYTESEVVGRPITLLIPDDLHNEAKDISRRVWNGEHIERHETVGVTKQGKTINVSATVSPITDSQGRVVSACRISRDITERKQFEKSLLWRLEFESLLSDLSRTFISLSEEEVDANIERGLARIGEFLEMDRITLFEFDQDCLNATHTWNTPGVEKSPASISRKDLPWWARQVLRGEMSLASTVEDVPVEASVEREYLRHRGIKSAASIPLVVSGEITGAIAFLTVSRQVSWTADLVRQLRVICDIFSNALERKYAMESVRAAHATVREGEERFRLVADTTPAMIWMSGADRLCNYVNQSWLAFTGRSLESELGNGWASGVHPDDLDRCLNIYSESFDRRVPIEMEYRLRRHDGQYRWVFDAGVPRFNMDGSFAGYIGSCIDVTDRKQAEVILSNFSQRLIQAQEQERAAVARELHDDVNQRIVLAALNLERLIREGHSAMSPEATSEISLVMDELRELAGDIQALSYRLHSSRLEQLGLRRAAASLCREISTKHKVKVEFQSKEIPEKLPDDVSLCLFRVMQEALQNSTKHSGSTQFQVSLIGQSDEIQLTVRDSGRGFDPQEIVTPKGLGLTSMKERLKLVNGQLSIETAVGCGTVIVANVPLDKRSKAAEAGSYPK